MADIAITVDEMRADLERKVCDNSKLSFSGGKPAYIATPIRVEELDMLALARAWYGDDSYVGEEDVEDLLGQIGADEFEVLVSNARHFELGIWWYWQYKAFRLGDRGYIHVSLWESEEEMAEVILGAWEPYNDTLAFESCFVQVYSLDFENTWVGHQYTRGPRVSKELLRTALMAAVELRHGNVDLLNDVLLPQRVNEYIEKSERESV